jgi:hypothetical protein
MMNGRVGLYVALKYHFIREKIQSGEVKLQRLPGQDQVANGFTKPLTRPAFEKFVKDIGLTESSCFSAEK